VAVLAVTIAVAGAKRRPCRTELDPK
jgi:hypothetical protein